MARGRANDTGSRKKMKKTPLKRYTPLKVKTGLKRSVSRTPRKLTPTRQLRALKDQLWELCRKITEKRYPNLCYTCGKAIEGQNRQLGHCIPSSVGGAQLRYNLDNLRWQCMACNVYHGGQGAMFIRNLVRDLGDERVDAMFALKNSFVRADRVWFNQKIEEYKKILSTP